MAYSTNMYALGKQLKDARIRTGMTQEQAADAIGVIPLTISNWETGKKTPRLKKFIELLNLYESDFDDVVD